MNEVRSISVVVPMYNEEKVVEECYKRLTKVLISLKIEYEIIFVNDGSRDNTEIILRSIAATDTRARVINFSRNFGHQTAVTAGICNAEGDVVVLIDADLQDPPELIEEMVKIKQQGYDVVYGKRKHREGETLFKLITAKYFYRFINYMSDVDIPKDTGDFRLMDRKVVDIFKTMPERNRFIRGMVSWIGFKQTAIEYEREKRFAGKTKYSLSKMINFAYDGIISFSNKPLKFVSLMGLATVFISIVLLIYSIVIKLTTSHATAGWASIMVTITFLGGMQLFAMGIIGEYIARIYDESKNRPMYVIKEKLNFKDEDE
ncbi:glycosyltransferase family 2 protein [Clostridium oryzae]|uniref:Glycosyltransferase 2-like domain-containing protein n=1 Tax=Clostridium oryzae TaxID=1450648 RepID=A0A1V4IKW4_9CLOT|nr:glycosyltransferase family 2 protein [Clostridium oryzae]OPJ60509.1 hypothetical protein CLORY_28180 [Clostridium oryzae]